MRVLRIFHGGGIEAYQRRDEEIASLGHDVTLVVPRVFRELPEPTVATARSGVISVRPIGLYGWKRNPFYFYSPFVLANILRAGSFDVIDMHEEPYSLAALSIAFGRALSRTDAKVVFRSSQNVLKRYPVPFRSIERAIYKMAAAAYVPSDDAKAVLERKGFSKQVEVIGNGVEVPSLARRPPSGQQLCVAYVGRLDERKGIVDLLEAVAVAESPLRLVVMGSGELLPRLRQIASARGVDDRVEWLGAVSHSGVIERLLMSDVICVPSRVLPGWSEQFSRALVEGMAAGCVPLVSSSGAIGAVAGPEFPSFPWGDVPQLARELDRLAAMGRDALVELGARASEIAAEKYSWRVTSARIAGLYSA